MSLSEFDEYLDDYDEVGDVDYRIQMSPRLHIAVSSTTENKVTFTEDAKEEEIVKRDSFAQFMNPVHITADQLTNGSEVYESVKCYLCEYLSIDPVYMCCCDFIVCKSCIQVWLSKNKKCPKCKMPEAKFDNLTKFMNKIFNNLQIKCKFYSDDKEGCKERTLPHKEIVKHQNFCEFNPNCLKKCEKCQLVFGKEKVEVHDCVKELVKNYQKLQEELEQVNAQIERENKDEMIRYLKHALKIHKHPLIKTKRNSPWKCSTCNTRNDSSEFTYCCYGCELAICPTCFDYSLDKESDTSIHSHSLVFKMPHGSWTCNICRGSFPYRSYSFRCDSCDFDQCFKCRFKK